MALESGGRADKLGNEFERLWGVLQLLRVLHGEAVSVLPEGLGPDEKGVDLWVKEQGGAHVGHQCKRENGACGKWSVADLSRERILQNAQYQLGRGPEYHFAFVSSDPVLLLVDLVERTGRCDHDPTAFATYLATTSRDHRKAFEQLARYLSIDHTSPGGQAELFDLLSRIELLPFDRSRRAREEVKAWSRLTVTGDPENVVSLLGNFLIRQIGNELHADQIRGELRAHGFEVRDLSGVPELHSSIEDLKDRFRRSFVLLGGKPLGRSETEQVWEQLCASGGQQVVCVHGQAGHGKSGVLFELAGRLDAEGIPFVPIRLDRLRPGTSPDHYGKEVCGLPSSPAASLRALAGGRMAVLILDQLDAVRWTSGHSSEAWSVCEEVIEEALKHPNLHVVVACRTFDLNDDPAIRAWKESKLLAEVKVGKLPDEVAKAIVSERGAEWASFSATQRGLLNSPQHLYLWAVLREEGARFTFRTATDLMRAFWDHLRGKRLQEMSVSVAECNTVLADVVSYMDRNGQLVAPERLGGPLPRARDALTSVGVFDIADGRIAFQHQSHFDFLVAERLLRDIAAGQGDVVDWLVRTKQSLFRRDQLRQVLALLRDEDTHTYDDTIRTLIKDDRVRFHIKHLVLGLLRYSDPPTEGEKSFVLEMLNESEWREHVVEQVLRGSPAWFQVLDDRGVLEEWLESEDDYEANVAAGLMRFVCEIHGRRIAALLRRFERRPPPWPDRLASVFIFSKVHDEAPQLLALRLRLMRRGSFNPEHVDWKELSQKNPHRALVLFRLTVSRVMDSYRGLPEQTSEKDLPSERSLRWDGVEAVAEAAKRSPVFGWRSLATCLVPRREVVESAMHAHYRYECEYDDLDDDDPRDRGGRFRLPEVLRAVEHVMRAAGSELAKCQANVFFEQLDSVFPQLPGRLQRVPVLAMVSAPDDYADQAIEWLCDHPECLVLCPSPRPNRWEPARKLIERFSPGCSEALLRRLEEIILSYQDPHLRRSCEHQRDALREGRVEPNEYGWPQCFLLSAVPTRRLSERVASQLRQWKRKFQDFPSLRSFSTRVFRIVSPIPREKLLQVSDKSWLEIVRKDMSKASRKWRELGPDVAGESSHRHFADDMREAARWQPGRFARLALRIPKDAYGGYLDAIMNALRQTEPPGPAELPGAPASWEPATASEIEAVLDHVGYSEERGQARSYCSLIADRADAGWSQRVLRTIIRYATEHPDPAPGEFHVSRVRGDGEQSHDIGTSAINCVRGAAAWAIHKLLFEHPDLFELFRPAVEKLVADPSPAVRVASVIACLPILNIDMDTAVDLFVRACEMPDDRILATPYPGQFIAYTSLRHFARLGPLFDRMVHSRVPDVASAGASWATQVWLHAGAMETLVRECLCGSVPQRKGGARGAAYSLRHRGLATKSADLLRVLMNDASQEVRREAASAFWREDVFEVGEAPSLCRDFALSRAFDENADHFLRGLNEHVGPLAHYADALWAACGRFCGPRAQDTRDVSKRAWHEAGELARLLLRLYQQAEDARDYDMQARCLDAFDEMLRSGVGGLRGLLDDIDG